MFPRSVKTISLIMKLDNTAHTVLLSMSQGVDNFIRCTCTNTERSEILIHTLLSVILADNHHICGVVWLRRSILSQDIRNLTLKDWRSTEQRSNNKKQRFFSVRLRRINFVQKCPKSTKFDQKL